MIAAHRMELPSALVTGASRGVGAAVARALGPTHHVVLGGRDRGALSAVAGSLPSAQPWPVDLTRTANLVAAAGRLPPLQVLVHSAGVIEVGDVESVAVDTWRHVFEVNLFAIVELTRLVLPGMRRDGGHVVFLNSTAGLRANPRRAAYAASKYALRAFADSLRAEEQEKGIRVTSLYLGRIDTAMQWLVCEAEGLPYRPDEYLPPWTVGEVVRLMVSQGNEAADDLVVRGVGGVHGRYELRALD